MNSNNFAKRKSNIFNNPLKNIGISIDKYKDVKFVLIHFFDNSEIFNLQYFSCESLTELNECKSMIQNKGFSIDWNLFNKAMEHLN